MKGKRAWLYYRLSRDEDKELNSLTNQKKILVDYAEQNGYQIIGESFDDNKSGMHFERDGLEMLQDAAEKGLIDLVLVKDLSRLGRHKTLTPLFIDNLRQLGVRVFSVTENIDTFNENDDLIVGFKQIINDHYAKDISRKIRAGFKQKQKEGIVIIPPFGYKKDKNTNQIEIVEECAEIVRMIFRLYIEGMGIKKIAAYLTDQNYKSPGYYQKLFLGKSVPTNKTKIGKEYIWSDKSISHILRNEAYIGTLICGKTTKSTIYKTRSYVRKEDQIRHENFYPAIISREAWKLALAVNRNRKNNNVRASTNKRVHRYAGLIRCADCGATFVAKNRKDYVEYVCNTYHRIGSTFCTSHRIKEEDLDEIIYKELQHLRFIARENWEVINSAIDHWKNRQKDYEKLILKNELEIQELKEEIKQLIRQIVKEPQREELLNEMVAEDEAKIKELENQIALYRDQSNMDKSIKVNARSTVDILEEILSKRQVTNAQLQYLIERIEVRQAGETEVDLEFIFKIDLMKHKVFHQRLYSDLAYTEGKAS